MGRAVGRSAPLTNSLVRDEQHPREHSSTLTAHLDGSGYPAIDPTRLPGAPGRVTSAIAVSGAAPEAR